MLAAFVCRPVFFRLTHATRGFPGNASGAVGELRAIACANARAGAAGGNAAAAAGRFAQRSSGLLAPFRRHLRVVPPVAAAWKKTRTGGFVRVENITGNVTARSTGSGGGVPRGTGTSPLTRKQNQKPVRNVQAKVSKTEMGKRASVHSRETEKGLKTKGVGSRAYIQVLGLGVDVNDTSASVLLFTDTQRILFNVGEGFQRFAVENGINIRKLNRIVLTQVNSRTTGGLTGMLLTMADGATEHHDDEPTLVIHGPPRTERLMGAVDTLVGGRGVRAIVKSFPTADAGGGVPTVDDDCVRLVPIVVRPKAADDSNQSPHKKNVGPLGEAPSAKRLKSENDHAVDTKKRHVFSALSVPSHLAESVCYHGQLAGMPGKFDAAKADSLGVPRGAARGQLVRGLDVTLPDGRIIKSIDVVAPPRCGFRFFVIDLPTAAHLAAVSDPNSNAYKHLLGAKDIWNTETGDLAVVVHLAPGDVANSTEYTEWMETCPAFISETDGRATKPRHLMVYSIATGAVPVFRAAAAINARLHSIDELIFPDPRNSTLLDENTQKAILTNAQAVETQAKESEERNATGVGEKTRHAPVTLPGSNLLKYTLVPLERAGLDWSSVPKPLVASRVRDELSTSFGVTARTGGAPASGGDAASTASTLPSRDAVVRTLPSDTVSTLPSDTVSTSVGTSASALPSLLSSLKPGDLELAFLGTGSSMPAKYRNVSGIFLDSTLASRNGTVVMDCGEGSFGQLCRLYGLAGAKTRLRRLRLVWISHIHADHHVGLPTILVERRDAILEWRRLNGNADANANGNGTSEGHTENVPPLLVIGPAPLRRFLNAFSQVQPLDFEFVDCRQTTGEKWDERFDGVKATEGTSDADDGANANANALPDRFALDPRVVEAATALGLRRIVSVPVNHCAQSFALALESTPLVPGDETTTWKVMYSGDTRPCASLTAASKNATVLIHEATFEDDLHEDAVRKRHSTTSEAIQCGTDAGVYRTILTHFSQRYPKAPVFDDGNFGRKGFGEAENADEKKDGDAAKKDPETTTSRVGVAFDLMRVDFTSLPRLPTLNPKIRHLFPDPEQKFSENGGEDASREF